MRDLGIPGPQYSKREPPQDGPSFHCEGPWMGEREFGGLYEPQSGLHPKNIRRLQWRTQITGQKGDFSVIAVQVTQIHEMICFVLFNLYLLH